MFTNRKRLAVAASGSALGAVLMLGGGGPANALNAGTVPAGSTVCTDQTRSGQGISFYGFGLPSTPTPIWSVRTAASAGGPETEVLRLPTWEPTSTALSWTGTVFYRVCVVTPTATSAIKIRVNATPAGNPLFGVGPHTATVGAGAKVCGEAAASPARVVGTSTSPVRWTVPVFNGDGENLRTIDLGVSTAVDQVIVPGENEYIEVCAANSAAAVLSFDLMPVG
jgi:hypothetical protein